MEQTSHIQRLLQRKVTGSNLNDDDNQEIYNTDYAKSGNLKDQ